MTQTSIEASGPALIEALADAMGRVTAVAERTVRECSAQLLPRVRRLEAAVETARAAENEALSRAWANSEALAVLEEMRSRRTRLERAMKQVDENLQRFRRATRVLSENKGALFRGAETDLRDGAARLRAYLDHAVAVAGAAVSPSEPAGLATSLPGPGEVEPAAALPAGLVWTSVDAVIVDAAADGRYSGAARLAASARLFRDQLLPLLRARADVTRDGLAAMDEAEGRTLPGGLIHPESLAAVHDAFLGPDPIAGEDLGDGRVRLTSGRRRFAALKAAGLRMAPMGVTGRGTTP